MIIAGDTEIGIINQTVLIEGVNLEVVGNQGLAVGVETNDAIIVDLLVVDLRVIGETITEVGGYSDFHVHFFHIIIAGSSQRHQDRGRDQSSRHGRDNYSRNRSQAGNRSQGNWQGGNGGNWGGYSGSQGNWQGQSGNWNPNYGNQGKWNYSGQSGGSGGYSQPNYNWNYQGQYMNWIGQGNIKKKSIRILTLI